ncbi:unnamed protein product [Aspergillus oryzae]|nr:unnamed protein product [Aspergillus oryzae]
MSFSVEGRSAIVTGAGSGMCRIASASSTFGVIGSLLKSPNVGINFAFAKLLLENGCNVLIADLALRPEAQDLVEKYSIPSSAPRAVFQRTDVTDWKQLELMFEVAEKEFGEIDVHIVHISSIAGQNPALAAPIYVATKHAINGLVRSLGKLDSKFGIRVTAVAPGVIKTPLWTDHPEKLKIVDTANDEWVTPEEVAQVMLALIQQDQVSEIIGDRTGQGPQFPVCGGTVLEVSKTVRSVSAINDPGPGTRAGNTVSDMNVLEDEVFGLLSQKGWGTPKL